jgi:hypothetical protein
MTRRAGGRVTETEGGRFELVKLTRQLVVEVSGAVGIKGGRS